VACSPADLFLELMTQPVVSAVEQARLAWRRAVEEKATSLGAARDQAEAELRRRLCQLWDALEQALATGMSLDDLSRRLGLSPGVVRALLGRDGSPMLA
jgi:hypothetical protein